MPKGPLRLAIEDFLFTNMTPAGGPGWWERVKTRWATYYTTLAEYEAGAGSIPFQVHFALHVQGVFYGVFGDQGVLEHVQKLRDGTWKNDASQQVAEALRSVFSQPAAAEIAETLGTVVTEPVLTLFEQYAGKDNVDPKEFARAFHGLMIGLNVSGGLADTLLETLTGGQVEGAGRMLQSIYWSFGFRIATWT